MRYLIYDRDFDRVLVPTAFRSMSEAQEVLDERQDNCVIVQLDLGANDNNDESQEKDLDALPGVEAGEVAIPLLTGNTLICGPAKAFSCGGYLRICDANGIEVVYWSADEWETDPELVIGAVFNAAVTPTPLLLAGLGKRVVVGDHWE